jgi:homogentisate 1,2-dioxygenase
MSYRDGDYILIPRSAMWRIEPNKSTTMLIIEATNGAYQIPEKGVLGPHAIFDQAMFDIPEIDDAFIAQQTEDTWKVKIKKQDAISTVTFPFNPLDVVGWKGDNTVVSINWRDLRPLMSHRYHLPPSAHITFIADGFVICTFVPRPFETDEGALKIPFFHGNDDYDEVLFYHAGDFFSRDNIHPGMVTFHPAGFPHGPHPKALKRAFKQTKQGTDEVAVMLDTRSPLEQGDAAKEVESVDYINSWKG